MFRRAVSTDRAAVALGVYSRAIVAGGLVFCSGTAGIDPFTGAIPHGIEAQTEQVLFNLDAVLVADGASLADVVKTTFFYADASDFERWTRSMPGTCQTHRRPGPRRRLCGSRADCPARSRRLRCCEAPRRDQSTRRAGKR
jgi:enamine deaminase RidA (YjgF/YER057c/UK114 family)